MIGTNEHSTHMLALTKWPPARDLPFKVHAPATLLFVLQSRAESVEFDIFVISRLCGHAVCGLDGDDCVWSCGRKGQVYRIWIVSIQLPLLSFFPCMLVIAHPQATAKGSQQVVAAPECCCRRHKYMHCKVHAPPKQPPKHPPPQKGFEAANSCAANPYTKTHTLKALTHIKLSASIIFLYLTQLILRQQ